MADGVDIPQSHSRSSDHIFDKNCTVCERKQKIREAINYCIACCEYFCAGCLDFHNSLPVLSDHAPKLLGRLATLKSLPSVDQLDGSLLTTICEHHGDKVIMFCGRHDALCCSICLAMDHRTCEEVNYIPKIAQGFAKDPEVSKIKLNMETVKKEIHTAKSSRQSDQTRIDKERNRALAQIKDSRRRVNTIFDKLEQVTIGGTDNRYKEHGINIQMDLKECDEAINDLEKSMHELEVTDKNNEPQLFVNTKRGSKCVQRWQHLSHKIQDKFGKEMIVFIPDETVQRHIAKMAKLGTFTYEMQRIPSKTWPGRKDLSVRIKEDKKPGNRIRGSCSLPDGKLLLTDTRNNKLKRLNSSYKVTDFYSVIKPLAVCFIESTQEAAVTEGETNTIHIVTMGKSMLLARKIDVNHSCFGVAFNKGLLFVGESTDNKLHIYDYASGQHRTTMEKDRNGQNMFSTNICHIVVSSCGNKMYVADFDRGLIIVDREQNLAVTVTDAELTGATGVCLDKNNNVYVCGRHSRTVLKFNFMRKQIGTLIQQEYITGNPWSVCLDNSQARLCVTMEHDDTISMFDLTADK